MNVPRALLARLRSRLAPPLTPPLVLLVLLASSGCLSTKVNIASDRAAESSAVLVRVYADPDAAEQGRTESPGTLTELFAVDRNGKEVFLQRSLAGQWGVDQLPPGRYRLRVVALLDAAGNIRDANPGDRKTDFTLDAGQTAEVNVVLKKTPTALIVTAVVTVVILVVALAVILENKHGSPPVPKLPHPPRGLPPPPPIRTVVVAPEIWVGPLWGAPPPDSAPASPRVTSVVPEPGSLVNERRVTPTLTLSQPVDTARIAPDAIRMLGTKSGLVRGRTVAVNGLVRFEPSQELSPGETVTVTLQAAGVVNLQGRGLEKDFSWSFQIGR
ncbi:MAG: Ig-like domain-containing protein [Deltaproteobacteria bacterium]|nr:Ig-like domain-containing protein [Deltaproteobacteria bacterium]